MYRTDLTRAYLIYVPPHHEQYYRPFESQMNGDVMRKVGIYTEGGNHLSAAAVADIASSVISPSAMPSGKVQIPYGMNEARMAFFIEITKASVYGGTSREIFSGFTSHVGVDQHGNIDPTMIFYIDSRMEIRDGINTNHMGSQVMPGNVWADTQLLTKTQTPLAALRPEDVVGTAQVQSVMGSQMEVYDQRANLTLQSQASDRLNTIPAHYLSKIMGGYMAAHGQTNVNDGDERFYENAIIPVKTESYQLSNFLSDMGMLDLNRMHTFTFQELNSTYPKPASFWIKTLPKPGATIVSPTQYSEHWGGSNIETSIAYSLTHILPALMARLMLVHVVMEITNVNTPTGMPAIGFAKQVGMFDGAVTVQKMEYFKSQVMIDIVRGLLQSRVAHFTIRIDVDLTSSGKFDISVNGGMSIPYVAPMWCESYSSPVLGQARNLNILAASMEELTTNLAAIKFNTSNDFNASDHDAFAKSQSAMFGSMAGHTVAKAPVQTMAGFSAPRRNR